MAPLSFSDDRADVFRDDIKERRDSYYVTYQPADSRYPFAFLHLVYPDRIPERTQIIENMNKELAEWLDRFSVPVMVSAFDAADDSLEVQDGSPDSYLMGYLDQATHKIVRRWGTFGDNQLPIDQTTPQYLSTVYSDAPFRLKAEVRREADENAAQLRLGMRLFRIATVFWFGIPLMIEIISLGINWIGYALWSISVSVGLYKFVKVLGWKKPSKRQLAKDEEARKMRHYYYHCEKNPAGFDRLKTENFECETVKQTRKEFNALLPSKRAAS